MKSGDIYKTNRCGDIRILSYNGCFDVDIEFVSTGYKKKVSADNVRRGKVADPYSRLFCGVGYIGDGKYNTRLNGKLSPCYQVWYAMIRRCYSDKQKEKQPTYKDCTVCDEWHNFQNFASWYHNNKPDGGKWQVDKDIKFSGNRIYSPETCVFVSHTENTRQAHAKIVKVISPSGEVMDTVPSIRQFSAENGLNHRGMAAMISGKYSNYKGWRLHGSSSK